jgi:hypothetical protein
VQEDIERVGSALTSEQGIRDLTEVCAAAYEGRLDTLLVAGDVEVHGSFNRDTESIELHEHGTDLLEFAARHAWKNGARVRVLPLEEIPGRHRSAALIRSSATPQ